MSGSSSRSLRPNRGASTLRFSHVIVAEALAAELNPEERAFRFTPPLQRLCPRGVPTTPTQPRSRSTPPPAPRSGTAALAVDASSRAARLASAHGAHSEAARHWATAAAMIEGNERQRLDALVSLASAHERADEMREARTAVVAAIDLAARARRLVVGRCCGRRVEPREHLAESAVSGCRSRADRAPRGCAAHDAEGRLTRARAHARCTRHRAHAQRRCRASRQGEPRGDRHGPPPR